MQHDARIRWFWPALCLLSFLACLPHVAQAQTQWENEILAYEAADRVSPPPAGAIVVTGSSTIRLWTTMATDLAPLDVLPRGFGGSTTVDLDYYLERVVLVYRPRAVVIYEGDNDIDGGQTPQQVADRMGSILSRISARLPAARVYVLSIKPSPSRWGVWPQALQANALLAALCATDARYTYINAASTLLGADGLPRPDYYQSDQLHLNAAGYAAWTAAIRPTLLAQQSSPLPADVSAPTTPTGLAATPIATDRIDLRWNAASDAGNGLAGYRVFRDGLPVATTTATQYAMTGLTASTAYSFAVAAFDRATPSNSSATSPAVPATTLATTAPFALRINAAGPAYVDSAGNSWAADTGFNAGSTANYGSGQAITGTSDPTLYRTERWDAAGAPELSYTFTVPNGSYLVRLHFAENYSGAFAVGRRVFSVQAEGLNVLSNLDIYAAVGAHAALVRSVNVLVADGQLNLTFIHGVENPLVNAIEVIAQGVADTTAPTATGTLTAGVASATQVNLSWGAATDNIAVTGYEIERCSGSACTGFAPLVTVSGTSFVNSPVLASTDYGYRVRARDAAGNTGPYSAVARVTTPAAVPAPTVTLAANPASLVSGGASTLTWSSSGATACTALDGWSGARATSGTASTGPLAATTLYSLTCTGAGGSTTAMTTVTVTAPPDTTPPGAPGTLLASATSAAQVSLSWGSATDDVAVTGYELERCSGSACTTFALLANVTGTSFVNTTVTASTDYGYRVRARDAAGNTGPYSAIARVTTPPPAPTVTLAANPSTLVSGSASTLSWNSTNATSCTASGGWSGTLAPSGSASSGSLTVTTLFGLRCDGAGGSGTAQATVTVTPPPDATPPTAPPSLTASAASSTQASLSWGAATDNVAVTAYEVERCSGAACTGFATLATVTTGTSFTDGGVTAAGDYGYRVRARDAAGNTGPYSPVARVTTPAVVVPAFTLRVNAAGPAYTDSTGNAWVADTGFNTGTTASYASTLAIAGTSDPTLYRTERWDAAGAPELAYAFTVPNGSYLVRLHFAENYSGAFGVGRRVFSVQAEGSTAISNLDIFAAVGGNAALVRSFTTSVTDGQLNLAFIHGVENPLVNAIEVVAQGPPTPDTTAPGAPATLTASAAIATQASLNWSAATDNIAVTAYEIERCSGAACTAFAALATVTSGTSYTDASVVASSSYGYRVRARDAAGNTSAYSPVARVTTPAVVVPTFTLRVNVGGTAYTDSAGNAWVADTGFNTGAASTYPSTQPIAGTSDPTLYRSERWDGNSAPELGYAFTVPNGNYLVRLHFAENNTWTFGVGLRVFSVQAEGSTAISNLDVYATAGARTALVRSFTTTVTDGQLNLTFLHGVEDPFVNGIEILAQP